MGELKCQSRAQLISQVNTLSPLALFFLSFSTPCFPCREEKEVSPFKIYFSCCCAVADNNNNISPVKGENTNSIRVEDLFET